MKLYSSNDAMAKGDLEIDYYVPIKIRFKKMMFGQEIY